jgi:hypothetical protein
MTYEVCARKKKIFKPSNKMIINYLTSTFPGGGPVVEAEADDCVG